MPLGIFAALGLDYVVEIWMTKSGMWRNGMTPQEWESKTEEERETMKAEHISAIVARNFNLFLVVSYLIVPGCSKMALDMLNCTSIYSKQRYIQQGVGGTGVEDETILGKYISNGILPPDYSEGQDYWAYGTTPRSEPAGYTDPPKYDDDSVLFPGYTEPHSYLTADMAIDCKEYQYIYFYQPLVWLMMFIYPIGIPLCYYVLLIQQDKRLNPKDTDIEDALESRMKDEALKMTQFLWFQYKPKVYYFEVVETLRRIILTAAITLVPIPWRRAVAVGAAIVSTCGIGTCSRINGMTQTSSRIFVSCRSFSRFTCVCCTLSQPRTSQMRRREPGFSTALKDRTLA